LQFFTASDGARIAYRDEGAGAPLVLLHGLLAHGGFFRGQAPLAESHRLITIDLRGHGESPANGHAPSVERIAADVGELVAALDLHDAIGVGWSLGATVLWQVLAGPQGERFTGAVVIDMTARVLNDGTWSLGLTPEACAARRVAIRDDFHAFAVNAGEAIFAQPVRAEHRDLAAWAGSEFARSDPAAMAAVWDSLIEQDMRPALPGLAHPTLIVHGGESQLYGDGTAAQLVASLPDARSERFDRCGHAPHLEEPERFNLLLSAFAARLSRASTRISTVS
jgi:pimeloyl-[acyl-carrier protein] methyl ester esterase